MVQINVPLPKSDSKAIAPNDLIVMMTKDGNLTFNGRKVAKKSLQSKIKSEIAKMSNKENASISIVAEVGVPWKKINDVIVIASKLKVKAHIATEARK